jgi:hypothetical protein
MLEAKCTIAFSLKYVQHFSRLITSDGTDDKMSEFWFLFFAKQKYCAVW